MLVRDGAVPGRLLVPCRNIQNELHARNPEQHPRDARTAYTMHADDLRAVFELETRERYRIGVIYHSHVDVGAYFSPTDRQRALLHGEPMYPEAAYLVVSVVDRRVAETAVFRWNPATRDFVSAELRIV